MQNFNKIEKKWQERWEKSKIFKVKPSKKKKLYVLEMFPYPSALGLHMGHVRNYAIGDCYARFKRMQGFNVLYPMGYDAFGLPAENAAIQNKMHPKTYTEKAIKNIMQQQKQLGLSYDWSRLIVTCYPEYYKWNQYFFLQFYKKGLAYKKEAPINWCPSCATVLANEQVEQGKCWRCKSQVEVKSLEQWFLKITAYAEELLKDLTKLNGWPNTIKLMQENWIGKSKGTEIHFKIEGTNDMIPIFTTRADTLYGVTFMVYAPEHPKVLELVKNTKYENSVKEFIRKTVIEDKFTRTAEETEKKGLFIGRYAINPVTNERIPIYIGNFVLLEYGAGAVMAVPAHDQRDFEFAKKYNIPIKVVIQPPNYKLNPEKMSRAYLGLGTLINSEQFNDLNNQDAVEEISKYLEKKKLGKRTTQYKLRDWLISRQRYWGTPIPVVYCKKCGITPIPENQLPVLLPEKIEFTGKGNPLTKNNAFINTKCPKCKGQAKRETDTMDTFFDSSWYFLRYCSPNLKTAPFDKKEVDYWLPVDQYIGGAEHAVMHLLYARFFCKVLRDLNFIKFDEPFINLFNQGTVVKDGAKMSKSYGNVVSQEEISNKYGIDTARLFLLFVASPGKALEWNDAGVEGAYRFLNKVYSLLEKKPLNENKAITSKTHKTIKEVTEYIENFEFNLAIIKIMEFVNYLQKKGATKTALNSLILLLNPFVPHTSEEIWEKLKNKPFASTQKWPPYDLKKINLELEAVEELLEKTKADVNQVLKLIKIKPKKVTLFVADNWKYDLLKKIKKELEQTHDFKTILKKIIVKQHAKEISRILESCIKHPEKIPILVLTQEKEFKILAEAKSDLEKEFSLKFEIKKNHEKALPSKPAILIE